MSQNQMSMGCSRSTAIAVVNALVVHLKFGHFVSMYEWIQGYPLRIEHGIVQEDITFRTNTGVRMHAECTVLEGDRIGATDFPVGRIVVALRSDRFSTEEARYFDCSFTEVGIKITDLDKWPF